MSHLYFDATDLDWELFENQFNIPRSNVVEVNNIYRHICKLYVMKDDLELWNDIRSNKENKTEITFYRLMHENKWSKNTYKNDTPDKSLFYNK